MSILRAWVAAIAMGLFLLGAEVCSASIVDNPELLNAKLEEMRQVRMAKQEADEAYWEDYRRNYKHKPVQICTKIYTDKGVYRRCRTEIR